MSNSTSTVYKGLWYDNESGSLILTVASPTAGFLSAALVTWVHFIASATWPIIRYLLWRSREANDVFHVQRNILLRNSSNARKTATLFIRLIASWRRHDKGILRRSLPYVVIPALFFAAWTAAALFVPYVYTHASTGMLLASTPHCGLFKLLEADVNGANQDRIVELQYGHLANQASQAQFYVQQCYNMATMTSAACSSYPRQSLPFTSERTPGACSSASMPDCVTTNSTVLRMDTGMLNSNEALGVNSPATDQVNYRRITTCSPVDSSPYMTTAQGKNGTVAYQLGPASAGRYAHWEARQIISPALERYTDTYWTYALAYYPNSTWMHRPWEPWPSMYNGSSADITLVTLVAGDILYYSPVYDPFFLATKNQTHNLEGDIAVSWYFPTNNLTALLCTEQHQICSATNSSHCSPLVTQSEVKATSQTMQALALNDVQKATVTRIGSVLPYGNIFNVVAGRQGNALLASQTLYAGQQTAPLPENQWEIEVQNWFSLTLAQLQSSMLQYVTGPGDVNLQRFVHLAAADPSSELAKLCAQQRIGPVAGYTNFDFSAIIVLLVVGIVLIPFGLLFDRIVVLVGRLLRLRYAAQRRDAWIADGIFQVQRAALEARGVMEWLDGSEDVPVSLQNITATSDFHQKLEREKERVVIGVESV